MYHDRQIIVAVKAIIRNQDKTLIMKRSDYEAESAGKWELPGGKIDFGEQPELALHREIQEEAGIEVTIDSLAYVSSFQSSSRRQVIVIAYQCTTDQDSITLSDEHSDYKWADMDELKASLPNTVLDDLTKNKII